ncbi:ATP-binding protein [Haloarcula sp. Atlit-7R]|uniref:ATP-binding protein n=1 Tax=Haloarcula sp. Atlit-7R TaxID=2282125 RepID=UPI000EF14EC1|nr:ATP-binding protein [Haloarcula sp. Atlit-7R]RLM89972.1 ATP-binding protein [Haloarcula sp. Atlit-7R]
MSGTDDIAHSYLLVEPSDSTIDPQGGIETYRTLSQLESTYEWTVTAHPRETGTALQYYLGADGRLDVESLKPHVRTLFPNSYRITRQDNCSPLSQFQSPDWTYAVEAVGTPDCYSDWFTNLRSFGPHDDASGRHPMTALLEALQESDTLCLLQICAQPTDKLVEAKNDIERYLSRDCKRPANETFETIIGSLPERKPKDELHYSQRNRLSHLEAKEQDAFAASVRVLVGSGPGAESTAKRLASVMGTFSGEYYKIEGKYHTETDRVRTDIQERTVADPAYNYFPLQFPIDRSTAKGIVADYTEIGSITLVDGADLTEPTRRAFDLQSDTTGLATPPAPGVLDNYDHGPSLGRVRNSEGVVEDTTVRLPPGLQPQHTLLAGSTGSGKTGLAENIILDNSASTGGADIALIPKGDEMATEVLRSHYARHGSLDDVYYFECSETLPAISVLDIRPELEAGIPRPSAVANTIDQYISLLRALMPEDSYDAAVRSPDVIRFLLQAQFDTRHGGDAFTHADLKAAAMRLQDDQTMPTVDDETLERNLTTILNTGDRTFQKVMGGVMTRLDTVSQDARLRALFNHLPEDDAERFDLVDLLDEDALIILDMGEFDSQETKQAITQVVLSNLWSALKRRVRYADDVGTDLPLVNLYLEEAATFEELDLIGELLDQSRSFGIGLTLISQFPAQFKHTTPGTYERLLNNVGTVVASQVEYDRPLAEALATDRYTADEIENKLGSFPRGEWLVSLPGGYGATKPDPFQVTAPSLPAGHPESESFEDLPQEEFRAAMADRTDTVRSRYGLDITETEPSTTTSESTHSTGPTDVTVDSPLPYTERLPPTVAYDDSRHALTCTVCDALYGSTRAGMLDAITCHDTLAAIDPANVPVCDIDISLSTAEREQTEYSHQQLLFLQAVYNAWSMKYESPMYDIVYDSMLRLREYFGIDDTAVNELLDGGLLKRDGQKPHLLYTVTSAGRSLLNESHRAGVDYGHGVGDLEETSEHRMQVEALARYLEHAYADDAESPVVEVSRYHEPGQSKLPHIPAETAMGGADTPDTAADRTDQRRFDVVGLDADGEIVIVAEAERLNNDVAEAVVADFDKMAARDPAEAIWVVPSRSAATRVVEALNDPPEGPPRVEKTYSSGTPPKQYRIDEPGLSQILTFSTLRDRLPERSHSESRSS